MPNDHPKNMNYGEQSTPKQENGGVMLKAVTSSSFTFLSNMKLWLFIWPDIISILLLAGFTFTQISNTVLAWTPSVQEILIVSIGPLFTNFLKTILPLKTIESLIFWRRNHALPGHRAFTKYANDSRVDATALKRRIGKFPTQPIDQNSCWYRLLQKHKLNTIISNAHKQFLFFRNSVSLTLLLLIVALGASILSDAPRSFKATLIGLLVLKLFLLIIAAKNTGIRLVQNVLSLESVSMETK